MRSPGQFRRLITSLAIILALSTAGSHADTANTKIAFYSDRAGSTDIYTMNPDGTDVRLLTTDTGGGNTSPAWSPDGSKIVFVREVPGVSLDIYVIDVDGGDPISLTLGVGSNGGPAWSPDGTKIAFSSNRSGESSDIYLMDPDGSGAVRLTDTPIDKGNPTWSPDGTQIAFTARSDSDYGLYVMSADGATVTLLLTSGSTSKDLSQPAWSPTGDQIAFNYDPSAVNPEIFVIDADGTNLRQLTSAIHQDLHPSWSPDATKIVFSSDRNSRGDIFVMDADGSNQAMVLNTSTNGTPAWSPYLPTHRFSRALPSGLSLFSIALHAKTIVDEGRGLEIVVNGPVMAGHLIRLGATVVFELQDGRFNATIGRDGVLLFGHDFLIEGGKGYAVNMLEPAEVTLIGTPHGIPIEEAPLAAPSAHAGTVWAFAIAGEVVDAALLPEAVEARVRNMRTGETSDAPLGADGRFITAFADRGQEEVVAGGDILRLAIVTRQGYVLGKTVGRRVSQEDLRRAFAAVRFSARPQHVRLLPNYPNPFNPETWIPFEVGEASDVMIRIYDVRGGLVRALDVGRRNAGYHLSRAAAAYWDGRNASGETVGGGIYFYGIDADNSTATRRMVVAK